MTDRRAVTRRGFMEGMATVAGTLALSPAAARAAEVLRAQGEAAPGAQRPAAADDYDAYAKLASNENPYGPPESVVQAMLGAMKYANRYAYPDGDLLARIARAHDVSPEQVLLGAGSGEILSATALAFTGPGRKVVGVDPTFHTVYQYATGVRAEAIRLPLRADHTQDVPLMVDTVRRAGREVGLVYLCNPNNPTGRIVPARDVEALLDAIPGDIPVLVDEAYHHFVEDPAYASSLPHVRAGRPVIVSRTFSKIVGLAGMRLGYAIAPKALIDRMRPYTIGSINALVKWGGVAALEDTAAQARVRQVNNELRRGTAATLAGMGYEVIPSETNFLMIHIRRPVVPVIDQFKAQGVLVGRPFPPMTDWLRVSVGTPEEMQRFVGAFRRIFAA